MNAQERPALRYTLSFPAPQTHYVEVAAEFPSEGREAIELMMAVWTPGSYLVRDFAGHVEAIRAETLAGAPLAIEKTSKNRWKAATGGAATVRVAYRVYCRQMSVRTNWVSEEFAILNGAPTFITLVGSNGGPASVPHEVRVDLPPAWNRSHSSLPSLAANHYVARDFDTLVDSPISAGNPAIYEFEAGGKRHYLVNEGEGGVWDGARSAADVEKVVNENLRLWGEMPYDDYTFFNMINESGGGLEHKNSTVMMTSRWATSEHDTYLRWLGLVSHEYFHTWNVKRLRPVELGPFDYERENYTEGLWVSEGFTSYYSPLVVHRAGLSTRAEFLESIGRLIRSLQTTPGRLAQPVAEASYDAWIRQYKPDENTPNTTISYYTKGAVIAFLLDAKIREVSNGAKSLDDAMRLAYERFSGDRGFTAQGFERVVSEVAGSDLSAWLRRATQTTDELGYDDALAWYGLRFKSPEKKPDDAPGSGRESAWLGFRSQARGGRLVITAVLRGTPAYEAGLNVDDELIAMGDYRVPPTGLDNRLAKYEPGETVSLLIARRDRLLRLDATFGTAPPNRWAVEADPDATPEQKQHLEDWLGRDAAATKVP